MRERESRRVRGPGVDAFAVWAVTRTEVHGHALVSDFESGTKTGVLRVLARTRRLIEISTFRRNLEARGAREEAKWRCSSTHFGRGTAVRAREFAPHPHTGSLSGSRILGRVRNIKSILRVEAELNEYLTAFEKESFRRKLRRGTRLKAEMTVEYLTVFEKRRGEKRLEAASKKGIFRKRTKMLGTVREIRGENLLKFEEVAKFEENSPKFSSCFC